MGKTRPQYPQDFRAEIVRFARSGRRQALLARRFEPSEMEIAKWGKQADLDAGRRDDGVTTDELKKL